MLLLNETAVPSRTTRQTRRSRACYPRWASTELRLFRTADLAWSRSGSRSTVLGARRTCLPDCFFAIRGSPPGPHSNDGVTEGSGFAGKPGLEALPDRVNWSCNREKSTSFPVKACTFPAKIGGIRQAESSRLRHASW
jgi:hypothetical protein